MTVYFYNITTNNKNMDMGAIWKKWKKYFFITFVLKIQIQNLDLKHRLEIKIKTKVNKNLTVASFIIQIKSKTCDVLS